ncbi:Rhomboid- protein 2 [Quaeritorhiza haematococci]|nr:Rhomboid- protein 2 [Quaeritorhiza haematococci]
MESNTGQHTHHSRNPQPRREDQVKRPAPAPNQYPTTQPNQSASRPSAPPAPPAHTTAQQNPPKTSSLAPPRHPNATGVVQVTRVASNTEVTKTDGQTTKPVSPSNGAAGPPQMQMKSGKGVPLKTEHPQPSQQQQQQQQQQKQKQKQNTTQPPARAGPSKPNNAVAAPSTAVKNIAQGPFPPKTQPPPPPPAPTSPPRPKPRSLSIPHPIRTNASATTNNDDDVVIVIKSPVSATSAVDPGAMSATRQRFPEGKGRDKNKAKDLHKDTGVESKAPNLSKGKKLSKSRKSGGSLGASANAVASTSNASGFGARIPRDISNMTISGEDETDNNGKSSASKQSQSGSTGTPTSTTSATSSVVQSLTKSIAGAAGYVSGSTPKLGPAELLLGRKGSLRRHAVAQRRQSPRAQVPSQAGTEDVKDMKDAAQKDEKDEKDDDDTKTIKDEDMTREEEDAQEEDSAFWRWADKLISAEQQRYKYVRPEDTRAFPWTALVFLGHVGVFIAMMVTGGGFASPSENPMLGPSITTMISWGANIPPLIRDELSTNWWRLFTAGVLHAGCIHLFVNLTSGLVLGNKIDRWFGLWRNALIYFGSMFGSQVLVAAVRVNANVSLGASGAICGLLGAITADVVKNWDALNLPWYQLGYWGLQVVLYLGIGLAPFVDNVVHVGGFVVGFAIGLIVCQTRPINPPKPTTPITTPIQTSPNPPRRSRAGLILHHLLLSLFGLALLIVLVGGAFWTLWFRIQIASQQLCHTFLTLNC